MHSYEIGVLSDASYEYAVKRSIISLKMCILGWIYELISNIFVLIAPILKIQYNVPHTYFVDPMTMFIVVPFVYLFNDDDTKEIIYNEGWYQGIKYVLGVFAVPMQEPHGQDRVAVNAMHRTPNQSPPLAVNTLGDSPSSTNNGLSSQQHRCQPRLYKSLPNIRSAPSSAQKLKLKILRRHFSSPSNLFQGMEQPPKLQVAETTSMRRNDSLLGSYLSLQTLNLD